MRERESAPLVQSRGAAMEKLERASDECFLPLSGFIPSDDSFFFFFNNISFHVGFSFDRLLLTGLTVKNDAFPF